MEIIKLLSWSDGLNLFPDFFFDGPVRSFEMAVFLLERYWLLTFTGMAAIQMTFSHGYEVRMPLLDIVSTRFL